MRRTKRSGSSSETKGQRKIHKVMKEHKEGTLRSGSGQKVKSRKQAIAIAMSEARKAGARMPRKKASRRSARSSA
jgi:hypothetical protein